MYKNRKAIILILLLSMTANFLFAAPADADTGLLQNVGDLISLGANTVREIKEAIKVAGAESRETLEALSNEIQKTIDQLSQTYQENLQVTIGSLDEITRRKLIEFQNLLLSVNNALQEDIRLIGLEARTTIQTAAAQCALLSAQITQNLNELIIVAGNTASFVVDKATFNLILVISVILLGIGLIVFACMLFTKKLPKSMFARVTSIVFIFVFLGIFAGLIFIPSTRVYAVTAMGGSVTELQTSPRTPKILFTKVDTVTIGVDKTITLTGINLLSDSKPRVYLGEIELKVDANDDNKIIANISQLVPSYNRTYLLSSSDAEAKAVPGNLIAQESNGKYRYIGKYNQLVPVVVDGKVPLLSKNKATLVKPEFIQEERIPENRQQLTTIPETIRHQRLLLPSARPIVGATGNPIYEGSYNVTVYYGDISAGTSILNVIVPPPPKKPADLVITDLQVTPAVQTRGLNVQVDITIANRGEQNAGPFCVEWEPSQYMDGKTNQVDDLAAGATTKLSFSHKYLQAGTYHTIARVDYYNNVTESNEENNTSITRTVQISEPQPPPIPVYDVTVEIYKVYVKNCQDSGLTGNSGELWFDFDINGNRGRFPSSGKVDVKNGQTIELGPLTIWGMHIPSRIIKANLVLTANDALRIWSKGTDIDDTSGNDSLGLIEKKYTAANDFGAGDREAESDSGDYKIYYKITAVKR